MHVDQVATYTTLIQSHTLYEVLLKISPKQKEGYSTRLRGFRFAVNNCLQYAMVFFKYKIAKKNSINVGLVASVSAVYTDVLYVQFLCLCKNVFYGNITRLNYFTRNRAHIKSFNKKNQQCSRPILIFMISQSFIQVKNLHKAMLGNRHAAKPCARYCY